jgi:hypothetical protein
MQEETEVFEAQGRLPLFPLENLRGEPLEPSPVGRPAIKVVESSNERSAKQPRQSKKMVESDLDSAEMTMRGAGRHGDAGLLGCQWQGELRAYRMHV